MEKEVLVYEDELLLFVNDEDPYPCDLARRIFLDARIGEFFALYDDLESLSAEIGPEVAENNAELRADIAREPARFVEITLPAQGYTEAQRLEHVRRELAKNQVVLSLR